MAHPFDTKLCAVVHKHESEFHTKRLVCYRQGQGHSEGSCNQNMTVFILSYDQLILLQPNLV